MLAQTGPGAIDCDLVKVAVQFLLILLRQQVLGKQTHAVPPVCFDPLQDLLFGCSSFSKALKLLLMASYMLELAALVSVARLRLLR